MRPSKTRRQITLRTLAFLILGLSVVLAMVAAGIQEGVSKLRAVSALEQLGSEVGWKVHPYPKKDLTIQPGMFVCLGKEYFGRMSWLELHNTTDEHVQYLRHLPSLPFLILNARDVSAEAMHELSHLNNLKTLVIRGSGIGNQELSQLPELPELERLEIHNTNVNGPGLTRLASQSRLRELRIDDVDIGDADLQYLAEADQLTWICFAGTKVTRDGARGLFEQLPNCLICVGTSTDGGSKGSTYYFTFGPVSR